MKPTDRKAALAQYRERKPQVGVYALRCAANGDCWVGVSSTLDKIENRHRFTLSQGGHPVAALQAAVRAHGTDAIGFEVLEVLDSETPEMARARLLGERQAHWIEHLGASRL